MEQKKIRSMMTKIIAAILFAIVAVACLLVIGYKTHIVGRIIGFIFYFLVISYAIYEFSRIFKLPF